MRTIFIALLFIGITIIIIGVVRSQMHCPPNKVEYRYVPRTFVEEQNDPTPITEIFAKMFLEPTPWIRHSGGKFGPANRRGEDINKYFISQS